MGIMLWNVRAIRSNLDKLDERNSRVKQDKVSHTDWVRVTQSQLSRQNRMSEQLAELSGKLDATIGISGGLKRIGEALERRMEIRT